VLPRVGRPVGVARLSDEALARQAGRGNERAFAAIYERYHQPLYGYCRSVVRNDVDAQDVLQSTFAGALSALKRRQRNAPLRPWLFRIAHNEAISLIRRRTRDAQQDSVLAAQLVGPSTEERAVDRAVWAQLTADLADLPMRLRSALLLRELAGLSHEEIGSALGTTSGGAKQAIFEARRALVELSQGRAMECDEVWRRVSDGDGRALRGRRIRAHLRDCDACEAFAGAIRAREAELRAFVPVVPVAAAAAIMARAISPGSGHGGTAAVGASTVSAAAVTGSLGKLAGVTMVWKALAGAAVIVTATVGVAGLTAVPPHRPSPKQMAGSIDVVAIGGRSTVVSRRDDAHARVPSPRPAAPAQRARRHPLIKRTARVAAPARTNARGAASRVSRRSWIVGSPATRHSHRVKTTAPPHRGAGGTRPHGNQTHARIKRSSGKIQPRTSHPHGSTKPSDRTPAQSNRAAHENGKTTPGHKPTTAGSSTKTAGSSTQSAGLSSVIPSTGKSSVAPSKGPKQTS
jgi:RNA polymerase sigma factor (sigma-70 family)